MSDAYTDIMASIRAKCADCADKLDEQHRLLRRLNEAHALLENAVLMIESGSFHGSNADRWVTLASIFTLGAKESPDWLKKALK